VSAPRILIVKTSSMGDVVHALPLASDLAARVPDATIDWVVEEAFAAIPRQHPAVSRVIPIALRRWREFSAARAALRAQRYDRIIDCQGLLKSALVARLADGPVTGPDRGSAREPFAAFLYHHAVAVERGAHAIARNRALGAAAFGYAPDLGGGPRFGLRLGGVPGELAPAVARPFAVLLTNASRVTKLWPDDRWQALEAWLAQQGLTSLLFWGSGAEQAATLARARPMRDARVLPRVGLDVAAAVLARARVVVGLDTGLSHLAAAAGAPTVGLFCDYDPALVGLAGDARCVSLGGVDRQPPVDEVIAAVQSVLA
jgi:heptosyltransferase-1